MRATLVPCEREQVHRLGGRNDLVLDAARARVERCLAAEDRLRLGEQFPRGLLPDRVERFGARTARAAEHGVAGAARHRLGVARPNEQDGDVGIGRQKRCRPGSHRPPGLLHNPDTRSDGTTARTTSAAFAVR
jgi:hypothetical protein